MSALQRKAQSGRQEHQARAMSVPKAMRLSVARVADDKFDMALAVIAVTQEVESANAIKQELSDDVLMLLLDGPDGRVGAAILGLELVTALIQQQTTGTVGKAAPSPRSMTATDAALCAPVIDAVLVKATAMLETEEDRQVLDGFRFGARSENKRLFEMALQASSYHVIRMTLDIAGGLHQSAFNLLLPIPEKRPVAKPQGEGSASDAALVSGQLPMQNIVMTLPAELKVILCKMKLPITQISHLEPGMDLVLPPDAFPEAMVTAPDGRVLGRGILGQTDGFRALRLSQDMASGRQASMRRAGTSGAAPGARPPDHEVPMSGIGDGPGELMDMEALDDLPDIGDLSGMASADDLSDIGDLPDLPDLETMPDMSDLPGFEDPPDLDNLPDLGDLPKLNSA